MASTIQEEQKSDVLNALRNETLSTDTDTLEIDEDKIEEPTILPAGEPEKKSSGENEEETVSGTEFPFPLTGWSKSSYIAIGALLMALILIVLRRITSQKHTDAKGKKKQAETSGATEDASSQNGSEEGSRTSPSGMKAPYSVGKVHAIGARKDQQDSYHISDYNTDRSVISEKGFLAIVADGMGGLSNGGAVSKLAVNTGMEYFYGSLSSLTPERRLLEMAQLINHRVNQFLRGRGERSGSTLVEALIYRDKLYFLTIGDSRIYLYRGGHMICLNRPHVYAEELALEGVNQQRSLSDMEHDSQKASLTSYLGAGRLKYLDRNTEGITLVRGDKIMLCSDGVFGTLNEESMEFALSKSPEVAAELLEQQVYAAGKIGQDNFTAVIIQCNEG